MIDKKILHMFTTRLSHSMTRLATSSKRHLNTGKRKTANKKEIRADARYVLKSWERLRQDGQQQVLKDALSVVAASSMVEPLCNERFCVLEFLTKECANLNLILNPWGPFRRIWTETAV